MVHPWAHSDESLGDGHVDFWHTWSMPDPEDCHCCCGCCCHCVSKIHAEENHQSNHDNHGKKPQHEACCAIL